MKQITGVMNIHFRNSLTWFAAPAMIMSLSFVVALVISLAAGRDAGTYSGGMISIYIFMFVAGTVMVKDTFPLALGFSVRRVDYFLGTTLSILAINFVWAVALTLLSFIESGLTGGWGLNMHFFHLPYMSDGTLLAQFWSYFAILESLSFLGLTGACMAQHFGQIGMYAFFIFLFVACSAGALGLTYLHNWSNFFAWFAQHSLSALALWLIPFILVCVLLSYALLRRAVVR
ncbi:hypothetical protein EPA93_12940 [Ktedonosporobacter rubrisoli]|uniref:Uncharacterized protein n=1 Tax=Ktedonosporobacter rubrisoli TaxID=2509675 RepID=A0A4P6JP08_KTERU|nr:hypothetical protein [Ktedonosporobacter rubrisoli]QBD76860.1 hypothetical protein EPA93_12940 [Ktedonosporobacter rubrisoli]